MDHKLADCLAAHVSKCHYVFSELQKREDERQTNREQFVQRRHQLILVISQNFAALQPTTHIALSYNNNSNRKVPARWSMRHAARVDS